MTASAGSQDRLAAALADYAAMVSGSPHNLVSARARGQLHERHIPECLAFAELLPRQGRFLDLGSGGGFPGMVVALHEPQRTVHLLDATGKKTAFLREAAAALGIDVEVHTGRAEELGRGELRESFDVVTARAVAPLVTLVGWATPFLGSGGCLFAIKGERWETELHDSRGELGRRGLAVRATPSEDERFGPTSDRPEAPRVVMLQRVT